MTKIALKSFSNGNLFRLSNDVDILPFAQEDGDRKKPTRRFQLTAYSGDVVVHPWDGPIVIDLDSLSFKDKLPTLLNHSTARIVGQSDQIRVENYLLKVSGTLYAWKEDAIEIIDNAEAGFQWQVSVGLGWSANSFYEYLKEGVQSLVNGRNVFGPCYIVRNAVLRENSYCVLGVDGNTDSTVFAYPLKEGATMTTEKKFASPPENGNADLAEKLSEMESLAKSALIDGMETKTGQKFSDEILSDLKNMDAKALGTFSKAFSDAMVACAPKIKDFSRPDVEDKRGIKADKALFGLENKNDTELKDNPPDDGKQDKDAALRAAVVEAAKKLSADYEKTRSAGRNN